MECSGLGLARVVLGGKNSEMYIVCAAGLQDKKHTIFFILMIDMTYCSVHETQQES